MEEPIAGRQDVPSSVDYYYIISKKYDTFTKSEKKIADCLVNDKMTVVNCSITVLAKKLRISPATITRFCQKLNYGGFSELKYSVANNALLPIDDEARLSTSDTVSSVVNKLIHLNYTAILDSLIHIKPELFSAAARAIARAGAIRIYAEGGPGCTAYYAYQIFSQMGLPCQYYVDVQLALNSALQLRQNDVVIYICRTGAAKGMIRAVRIAKEKKATIIGITSVKGSKMAALSNIVLCYSSVIENNLRYLHTARICEFAVLGVLYNLIINYLPSEQALEKVTSSSIAIDMNQE